MVRTPPLLPSRVWTKATLADIEVSSTWTSADRPSTYCHIVAPEHISLPYTTAWKLVVPGRRGLQRCRPSGLAAGGPTVSVVGLIYAKSGLVLSWVRLMSQIGNWHLAWFQQRQSPGLRHRAKPLSSTGLTSTATDGNDGLIGSRCWRRHCLTVDRCSGWLDVASDRNNRQRRQREQMPHCGRAPCGLSLFCDVISPQRTY